MTVKTAPVMPRNKAIEELKEKIFRLSGDPVNVMEVCGTHTVAIARSGLRQLLPKSIHLLSGPGCPVCVTSDGDIDRVIALAKLNNITLATFGDMMHVPGTGGSLEHIRAERNNVQVVYSPSDVLKYAERSPEREFVFVGVGFETTVPAVAASVFFAKKKGIKNFSVAPLLKIVPPALREILKIKQRKIDGLILPGHVSTVIGVHPYRFIAEEFSVPGVISGFEPEDVMESLLMLLEMIRSGKPAIRNQYVRVVPEEGNPAAVGMMGKVFQVQDSNWRAIGMLPQSGLVFRPEFEEFDAFKKFSVPEFPSVKPAECLCGEILLGLHRPSECPLFRRKCTPSSPVGPCMVSSEGACAAAYHYEGDAN